MHATPGDIEFKTFMIGSLNLNDPKQAKKLEFNVYYDILSPLVAADVEILDENDAMGKYNLKGGEDVNISFTVPGGETISLKMVTFINANVNDNSLDNKGSMKHKTYTLKMISPELNKNRDIHISNDFGGQVPTHTMVQKAMKEISDKQVDTPDETKPQIQRAQYERVFQFLENIREHHVSQQYKSSAYVLFPTYDSGTEKYMFCTFEYLMSQGSKFEFKQDNTVGARSTTDADQMKNLIWCEIPSTFNSSSLAGSASNRNNYNLQTGVQQGKDNQKTEFKTLGNTSSWNKQTSDADSVPLKKKPPRGTTGKVGIVDPGNDRQKTGIADAKVDRARFLAYLSQNTIKFEIHGNPAIKVGDVVTLKLPKKADAGQDDGETQVNDKVLIIKIRHRILPEGNKPRYTMIVEAVKGGYK
jgi:hypothetical protein